MTYNVDYHFHPNIPRSGCKALLKCQRWWNEFATKGINVVIVSEHIYKNPERAFHLMEHTKPQGFYVFPGMEYLTKEGIDIVIFSKDSSLYQFKELKPYNLSYEQTLDFVLTNDLTAYVTHPHVLGTTSSLKKLSRNDYAYHTNKLGAVEITNTAFNGLYHLLDRPILRTLFANKLAQINNNRNIPEIDYPEQIKLLTAGSDAHNLGELGTFVRLDATEDTLFDVLISNKAPAIVERIVTHVDYSLLLTSAITCFAESLIKYKLRMFS